MSAKSAKKTKAPTVPRALEEIQKHYQALCLQAGQLQYQISVTQQELARLNEQLVAVNNEGAARKQLDSFKEETKNV